MVVSKIRYTRGQPDDCFSAQVSIGGHHSVPFHLYYRWPASLFRAKNRAADAFLAACLPLAMARGEPLMIQGSVSERLYWSSQRLMQILDLWWPELQPIRVTAKRVRRARAPSRGRSAGMFFTLGMDSFYTLLRRVNDKQPPLTHLLFVHGFDIRLEDQAFFNTVRSNLELVAREHDKTLLLFSSNLRKLSDEILNWGIYHGAALASVGLLLQECLERIFIPASNSYASLFPWGAHTLTDPLWSTECLVFEHEGAHVEREGKYALVGSNRTAQQVLRCCWENRGNRYNCGECEKCLRTMLGLKIVGALGQAATFPDSISTEALEALDWEKFEIRRRFGRVLDMFPAEHDLHELEQLLQRLIQSGGGRVPRSQQRSNEGPPVYEPGPGG